MISSGLRWFTEAGDEVESPVEWQPYLLELPVPPEQWESAVLRIGRRNVPVILRRIGGVSRVVAEWERAGPGHHQIVYRAAASAGSASIRIEPAKFGAGEFAKLLDALERELPAAIAIAVQQMGGLAGVDVSLPRIPTLAEEVQRLRRAVEGYASVPGLARLLREIGADPHVRLRNTSHWVNRRDARRPMVASLREAVTRADNLDEESLPRKLADTRVVRSFDTYENRLLALFAKQVERRLRRLRAVLESSKRWPELSRDTETLLATLLRARRGAAFLDEVAPLQTPPSQVTMVLLRRPWYKELYRAYRAFHRGLSVRLEAAALETPLDALPYLYQVWATLQVIQAFLETANSLGYVVERQRLIGYDVNGWFARPLPDGEAAVIVRHHSTRRRASLIPERTYPPHRGARDTLYSSTYSQRPDIAIEILDGAEVRNILVLDPKYKLEGGGANIDDSAPLKADVDKMHAYRDAIRDQSGARIVSFAGILYPGATFRFGNEIGALSARPDTLAALQRDLRALLGNVLGVQ